MLFIAPIALIKYRDQLKMIQLKEWLQLIIISFVLSLHFILWFESLNYTSVASSVILIALQPIFTFTMMTLLLNERFSVGVFISTIIALFGSSIIIWGDLQTSKGAFFGSLLAIIAAIFLTFYYLLSQNIRQSFTLLTYLFIVYFFGTIILLSYNLYMNHSLIAYEPKQWGLFLGLALLPTFLGYTLYNWAFKWLNSSHISMAIVFEPICATLLAYLILQETVSPIQWLGGTVFIFGLFLFIVSTARKKDVTISQRKK